MNISIKKALKSVSEKLMHLSHEEFHQKLEAHKRGDLVHALTSTIPLKTLVELSVNDHKIIWSEQLEEQLSYYVGMEGQSLMGGKLHVIDVLLQYYDGEISEYETLEAIRASWY